MFCNIHYTLKGRKKQKRVFTMNERTLVKMEVTEEKKSSSETKKYNKEN